MIRVVQRRLIIPRGDTGTFSVPVLETLNTNNAAILFIFNPLTHKRLPVLEGQIADGQITFRFDYAYTVNLPVGKYVWDIKFYQNPIILDGEIVGGQEVDSYYAAYSLPECEIRPTGDKLLVADDAPDAKLEPEAVRLLLEVKADVDASKERAIQAETAAETAANSIKNLEATAVTLNPGSPATAAYDSDTGIMTLGIPKGDQGDAFHITKTYSSIAAMNADYSGTDVAIGEFVIITTLTDDDDDNGKVYVKGTQQYEFIVDMSGVDGVGITSITKTATSGVVDTYTISFTDGSSSTFTVTNGESGVYVGTTEPTNPNVNVWINPDGEGTDVPIGGIPGGGTTGQVLKKHSNTSYDVEWANESGGGSGSDILTAKFFGAVGDKQTDDTAALSTAFNRSDAYIEGNNLFYKITEIVMTQCKNLVISNFRFYRGISITLKNCENIIFKNCVWDEFQDNGIENKTVHCVILTTMHTGSTEWVEANNWRIDEVCKQITFDNCQFIGTHYTESTPSLYVGNKPHYNTGMCLRLDGVDGLRVTGCYFTQNRGNACIQQNSYAPLGDFEITNNFFYLNGWAGVELYRYTAARSYPRRIIQGNRFIGHGLGYIPWDYLERIDEKNRGVGTAALLGGANSHIQNGYAHCAVMDNIFEDNNESSVEGWQWNPVKNNLIYGNGVLQSTESVVEMAAKYDIKYPLYIRKNPSQNPIYMGQYTDQRVYPEGETRTIENNTIGRMYGTRNPIVFRGYFYEPVIIRNNTMTDAALFTDKNEKFVHFLKCDFNQGIVWENNIGMRPYFNACHFNGGEFLLDDLMDVYDSTFTSQNFESISKVDRFQQLKSARINPEYAELRNNRASSMEKGKPILGIYRPAAVVTVPDPDWDIKNQPNYDTAANKYVFGGESNPTLLDTGLALGATDSSWTIFVNTITKGDNDAGNNSYYINLLSFSDNLGTSSLQLGSRYTGQAWTYVALNGTNSKVDGAKSQQYLSVNRSSSFVLRHTSGSGVIDIFARRNDATVSAFTDIVKGSFAFTSGFASTLRFGGTYAENTNAKTFYNGEITDARVFNKSLSNAQVSMLMTGSDITVHTDPVPVYDIQDETLYEAGVGLPMDGTFGVDTNIPLLENTADFTIVTQFQFADMTKTRRPNFTFLPVFSAMSAEMADQGHAGYTDKGICVGLSLQNGADMSATAPGGFITFRRDWRYTNSYTIDNGSYYTYSQKTYTVCIIRKDGVIYLYDQNLTERKRLTGDYANAIISGNLTLGARMGYDPLTYTDYFQGVIKEFKVYDQALDLAEIEKTHPSIYDNDASEKGAVVYHLSNKNNTRKSVRYAMIDIQYDLGEYNDASYTVQYPQAFGIKLDNYDNVLWVPCSSSKRALFCVRCKWDAVFDPFTDWNMEIVNPGIVPDLNVKIQGVKVLLLSKEEAVPTTVDATEFNISWEDELNLNVGSTIEGYIQYIPDEANSGLTITATVEDTSIATVSVSGQDITVTGVAEGETTLTVSIPYGATHVYSIVVTAP